MRVPDLKPALVSLVSALAASLCCLLPLAVIVLGLGSGAFMATTMQYQTILLPIGILGIATGYGLYFRERRRCRTAVCTMAGSRMNLVALIVATAILAGELGLVAFPEAASALFTGAMVSAADQVERFDATGTVVTVNAAEPSVTINHGEIKGLMSPMTMAFPVDPPELLQDVTPGDRVLFQLLRTPKSLSVVALTKEAPAEAEHVILDVQGMS